MENMNKLKTQLGNVRQEAGKIMKRQRNIQNNYKNGITGVE